MTVYVDDSGIPAMVGRIRSRWSHLTADDRDELHTFAARLGLRRAWFQDPCVIGEPFPARPGSLHAETWHYDVTASKREQAIRLGAKPITWRESLEIVRARHQRQTAAASTTNEKEN